MVNRGQGRAILPGFESDTMKTTFKTPSGLELEQLGTFTEYIKGQQFRFVVTRERPLLPLCVTHRLSGCRVVEITHSQQMASLNDVVGAAKLAIKHLMDAKGVDRVHDVLTRAEKMGYAA